MHTDRGRLTGGFHNGGNSIVTKNSYAITRIIKTAMAKPDIREDQLFTVNLASDDSVIELRLSAMFDTLHYYEPLGLWILKVLDDEAGLIQAVIEEEAALKIARVALIPVIQRDFIYQTEYESYLQAQSEDLETWIDE